MIQWLVLIKEQYNAGIQSLVISYTTKNLVTLATNNDTQGAGIDNSFAYSINISKSYVGTKAEVDSYGNIGQFGTNLLVIGY